MDAIRGMLDELMGKERDAPLHERAVKQIDFSDPDVCKYELASVCPNQLFKNTRSDLGACGFSIHADHLDWPEVKAKWEKLDEREKERYGYERDLVRYMEQLIREMDRKIEKNKERAAAESRPKPVRVEDQGKLDEIKARMDECLQRSMELGEAGDVDASMATAQQAEVYKRQHEVLFKQLTAPDRSMTVCDICGVFINSTDNDQRRLDHLTGKQYLGWKRIREVHAELVAKRGAGGGIGGGGPGIGGGSGYKGSGERSRSRGGDEAGERPGSRGDRDRERERERGGERERGDERRRERSRSPGRRRDYHERDRYYDGRGGGRDYYDGRGGDRGRDYHERERGGRDYERRDYERRDYERRDRRY